MLSYPIRTSDQEMEYPVKSRTVQPRSPGDLTGIPKVLAGEEKEVRGQKDHVGVVVVPTCKEIAREPTTECPTSRPRQHGHHGDRGVFQDLHLPSGIHGCRGKAKARAPKEEESPKAKAKALLVI